MIDLPKTKEELYGTYFLKADLVALCKQNDLPSTGSKENLLEYICNFIENKSIEKAKSKQKIVNNNFEPSLNKIIDEQYSNNETHRAFFKKTIGEHFKFNVQFMNWMNEHKGKKSYQDAIEMYNQIAADKKSGKKTVIAKQFEYNQYTRDFFQNNPTLSKEDCIKCWNYKKKQIGKHMYEQKDLIVLENQ
jgi:protein-arginine kinase activator protein McsA